MPHNRHELNAGEDSRREDSRQVKNHAHTVSFLPQVVEALPGSGARGSTSRITEPAVEVQVLESCEAEAEERPDENEPQDEVISLGEADGIVDFAR